MRKNYYGNLIAWALLVTMPLLFSSCKKDDDNAVTPSSITGNWRITGMKVNPAVDTGIFGKIDDLYQLFVALGAEPCLKELTFTFHSDGTASANNPAPCQGGDDQITDLSPISDNAKWSLSGNKLTITESDGTVETYDTVINGNSMTLSSKKEIENPGSQPVLTTMSMVLTRA